MNKTKEYIKCLLTPIIGYDQRIYGAGSFCLFFCSMIIITSYRAALSLSLAILLHELLHILAIKTLKYKFERMVFVPFFGAFVKFNHPENKTIIEHHAIISLSAPILGLVICYLYFFFLIFLKIALIKPLTFFMAMLFLISSMNLLPIYPSDGGQAFSIGLIGMPRLARRFLVILLFIAGMYLVYRIFSPLYFSAYIIAAFFLYSLWQHIKSIGNSDHRAPSLSFRIAILAVLFSFLFSSAYLGNLMYKKIKPSNLKKTHAHSVHFKEDFALPISHTRF